MQDLFSLQAVLILTWVAAASSLTVLPSFWSLESIVRFGVEFFWFISSSFCFLDGNPRLIIGSFECY